MTTRVHEIKIWVETERILDWNSAGGHKHDFRWMIAFLCDCWMCKISNCAETACQRKRWWRVLVLRITNCSCCPKVANTDVYATRHHPQDSVRGVSQFILRATWRREPHFISSAIHQGLQSGPNDRGQRMRVQTSQQQVIISWLRLS